MVNEHGVQEAEEPKREERWKRDIAAGCRAPLNIVNRENPTHVNPRSTSQQ